MLPHDPLLLALLLGQVFLVVAAYASVGHGGASGYLAVLSFFGLAPAAMAPSALCLNLLVGRAETLDFRPIRMFRKPIKSGVILQLNFVQP